MLFTPERTFTFPTSRAIANPSRCIQSHIHVVKRHIGRRPSAHTTRLERKLRRSIRHDDRIVNMHRLRGRHTKVPVRRIPEIYVAPAVRSSIWNVEVHVCLHAHALADFGGAFEDLLVVGLGLVAGVDFVEGYAGGVVDDCEGHAAGAVVGCPGGEAGG